MTENQLSQAELIAKIECLLQQNETLQNDKTDLEILLDTVTQHSTNLENEIYAKNQRMVKYIQQVELITDAAAAVENGTFEVSSLDSVSAREDELGQLARVFQTMVKQVQYRESQLKQQVQELQIEIDKNKKARQVADIVETDNFQTLKQKLKTLKAKRENKQNEP